MKPVQLCTGFIFLHFPSACVTIIANNLMQFKTIIPFEHFVSSFLKVLIRQKASHITGTSKAILTRENLNLLYVNNKDSDQPAHLCRLINIIVIHSLKSILAKPATRKATIQ